jgi:hypothetical protein
LGSYLYCGKSTMTIPFFSDYCHLTYMPQLYFHTIEFQFWGLLHGHDFIFPNEEYDPRADMRINYGPRSSRVTFMKRQGLSPGEIYRSADESTPLIMFICKRIIDTVISYEQTSCDAGKWFSRYTIE